MFTGLFKFLVIVVSNEMDQEIESDNHFIVKFGKEYSEESDEIIIIPEEEGEINIAWFLYEFIALGIPMKHIHEPGKCNRIMSKKLQKHRAVDSNDPDDVEDTEDLMMVRVPILRILQKPTILDGTY